MCLAALALNAHERFPLVIASNRDEFFARPAAPMAWWSPASGGPELLSGRDLEAGGSWFGLSRHGRLALLTNVREPGRHQPTAASRGGIVIDWLQGALAADAFAQTLQAQQHNGFNLIVADLRAQPSPQWHWINNRVPTTQTLASGVFGVSNAALDTPWPKTRGLKQALSEALAQPTSADELAQALFQALADRGKAPDAELPHTGVGLERERHLSPRFIRIDDPAAPGQALYGTRCSTLLICENTAAGRVARVYERSVDARGEISGNVQHLLPDWPPR
jgi:uncharacterized protein with NRDE domain